MLHYLSDLEDAANFSWANAKAAHVVFLCEMERGVLDWSHTERIDVIRRAHAQKHTNQRQNWGRNDSQKKPWYCKLYQSGTCFHSRDHEHNGKLYKHICATCLTQGKQAAHPQKDCTLVKRKYNAKKSRWLFRSGFEPGQLSCQ